jgi:hypothetical protein
MISASFSPILIFFLINPGLDIPTAIYDKMKKNMLPKTMIFHAALKAFYD